MAEDAVTPQATAQLDADHGPQLGPQPGPRDIELLLVCLRCARKHGALTEDGRTVLRQRLRERIAADGAPLRVVETSCLGLCPEGAITAALGRDLGGTRPQFYTVGADDGAEPLYRHVIARITPSA
jgi:hypothetical protein